MGRRRFAPARRDIRRGILLRLLVLLIIITAAVIAADYKIRPVVQEMASYYAKVLATRAINEAVLDELDAQSVEYGSLVDIVYGENGEVTAIRTDMLGVNRLKGRVSARVMQNFASADYTDIKLPAGTLFGGQFFTGRGPDISFRMSPAGEIQTDILNRFDSAGINQTRHQVMLSVKATVIAVIPAYTVRSEVLTNICVAETVIVGNIPEGFAQIGQLGGIAGGGEFKITGSG